MKVSELWLREWVSLSLTGPQLATQLTMAGLEVDTRYPVAGEFDHVVVAHVLNTKPHPQADKLTLCEVDAGTSSPLNIVCGAANVRPGLKVALALPGANLPGNIHIKETILRGQPSQGMLCSVAELALEESSEGIMELADDAPIGADVRDYLMLNDHVLDIDLTPNRADCFSILGVAREVAALNTATLKPLPSVVTKPVHDESLAVTLSAVEACPQYCGRIIRSINPQATTPLWMKERLRRSGIRSLHPVVDVTNYVMLELGQPMHAFDLHAIDEQILVRFAQKNERLILLDGQEVTLNEDVLVIADKEKPLAIAGVMGGQLSAVQAKTSDIFLESAYFNPVVIAGVARRYGLFTDSSQRFERGVDPALQVLAMERATELLLLIVGGQPGPIHTVTKPEALPSKVTIKFNPSKVEQLTGVEISEETKLTLLKNLGMVVERQKVDWSVTVPSHRFDISLEVDLVEEIVRLHGYDNIQAKPLITSMQAGQANLSEQLYGNMAAFLSSRGYHETISYSFVDPELQSALYPDVSTMQLLNPISSELSVMRVGMWSGLLASMIYNMNRQHTGMKLFEAGVVFDGEGRDLKERVCLAALITGEQGTLNWCETSRKYDFYDLKGDLQALFAMLNLNVDFVTAEHSALHPGQTAQIVLGKKEVGWIGVLHPRLMDALQLNDDVMLFELSLQSLFNEKPIRYQAISKYPQIRRDLSFLADKKISGQQIEQAVRDVVAAQWLKSFDIFDVYMGEGIPQDKKSLAISLTLQDDNRTLVDEEINTVISAIISKLNDEFAIILRD